MRMRTHEADPVGLAPLDDEMESMNTSTFEKIVEDRTIELWNAEYDQWKKEFNDVDYEKQCHNLAKYGRAYSQRLYLINTYLKDYSFLDAKVLVEIIKVIANTSKINFDNLSESLRECKEEIHKILTKAIFECDERSAAALVKYIDALQPPKNTLTRTNS